MDVESAATMTLCAASEPGNVTDPLDATADFFAGDRTVVYSPRDGSAVPARV